MNLEIIFLYIVLFTLAVFLLFAMANMFIAAPFVPTSRKTVRKMVEAAELSKDDTVYDLGSGDGRLVISAARKGVKTAVGFEINPLLNIYARIKARFFRLKNIHFFTKSLTHADLTKCNKLFVYLMPKTMKKLEARILEEMPEGSLVISNSFSFPGLKPIKEIDNKIKVYKITRSK